MRIAIIQPRTSYHIAGSEKISLKHAELLSKLGHHIDFYTTAVEDFNKSFLFKQFLDKKLDRVKIFNFDLRKNNPTLYDAKIDTEHVRWATESVAFDREIYATLNESKPDLILSYYLPDCLFKPPQIPNVIYVSGYPSNKIPIYKSFINFCDAAISISNIVSEKWSEELSFVDKKYILGTGVDYPLPLTSLVAGKEGFNIVFAGRLIERKGVLVLLHAFKKILENKKAHLWILGDGELREEINAIVVREKILDHITLTGIVENPQDYFAMADICVFPSLAGDGLMGVVLEAMSVGRPIIATKDNGNEDVITDNINGILIPSGNSNVLVDAISSLLDNEKKREELGKNAKAYIENNVAWDKNIIKLSDILEEITAREQR